MTAIRPSDRDPPRRSPKADNWPEVLQRRRKRVLTGAELPAPLLDNSNTLEPFLQKKIKKG